MFFPFVEEEKRGIVLTPSMVSLKVPNGGQCEAQKQDSPMNPRQSLNKPQAILRTEMSPSPGLKRGLSAFSCVLGGTQQATYQMWP